MQALGATPDPDPCAAGCVFETFGVWAASWWEIFQHCHEQWQDDKKRTHYRLDYQAIEVVFRAYGVEDYREGLGVLGTIIRELTDQPEYDPEWIFGWKSGDEE